ncbi:MAG TPA: hypothetical protein VFX20_13255 [Steroidobacteraceae bacterium]|nr:hypothetical protein [Steroidobacteraceae bacterium]
MPDSVPRLNEEHRYFPEWADRPEIPGSPLEADHNSYLAGGYSEEFGYRTGTDRPPVFPALEGNPDESGLWRVQVTGFHPGYPECPRPEDGERLRHGRIPQDGGSERDQRLMAAARSSGAASRAAVREFRVIRVGLREGRDLLHGKFSARLASILTHLPLRHRGRDH